MPKCIARASKAPLNCDNGAKRLQSFVMLSTGKRGTARGSGARSGVRPGENSGSGHAQWRSAAERYEVLGRAGEGTLFAVYRVRDRSNGRIHALKALKNAFVKHPRLTANLTRTAEQLKISRHALRYRMQRLNINTSPEPDEETPGAAGKDSTPC